MNNLCFIEMGKTSVQGVSWSINEWDSMKTDKSLVCFYLRTCDCPLSTHTGNVCSLVHSNKYLFTPHHYLVKHLNAYLTFVAGLLNVFFFINIKNIYYNYISIIFAFSHNWEWIFHINSLKGFPHTTQILVYVNQFNHYKNHIMGPQDNPVTNYLRWFSTLSFIEW